MGVTVPYKAPDFTLAVADGKTVSLADFAGKWLVLYFYPKDDTPGCTVEACSLRDAHEDITALGAVVVGVSRDDTASHNDFSAKYKLNFILASDPDHVAMSAYGAWGRKMYGAEGVFRKTFLIDPNGMVQKVYGRVTPMGHGASIAAYLKTLQAA